jgi:hypothetical protein
MNVFIKCVKKELETFTKLLKDLGFKVNESKTELVLFYRKDFRPITLSINGTQIVSASSMNVLGVLFHSSLQCAQHVGSRVSKANIAS